MWLFLATVLNSGQGVIFWAIASRLVDAASIGFAASLLSLAALASTAGLLGLDQSLIRFLPVVQRPRRLFAVSWALTGALGAALGGAAVLLVYSQAHSVSPALLEALPISGAVLAFLSIGFRLTNVLVLTAGHSGWVMIQSVILGLGKIAILVVLVSTLSVGTVAVLLSFGVSYVVAVLVGLAAGFTMWPAVRAGVREPLRRELTRFSVGNYASTNLWTLPDRIAPSLVLLALSAAATSYFYYGQLVALTLFYLPESICTSAFAHAAQRGESSAHRMRSLAPALTVITITLAAITIVLAPGILWILGGAPYAAHATLLRIYALSTIPQAGVFYLQSVYNVEHRIRELVLVGAIAGIAILSALSVELLLRFSVDGLPLAWVVGNTIGLIAGISFSRPMEPPPRAQRKGLGEIYANLLRPAVRDAVSMTLAMFRPAIPPDPNPLPTTESLAERHPVSPTDVPETRRREP